MSTIKLNTSTCTYIAATHWSIVSSIGGHSGRARDTRNHLMVASSTIHIFPSLPLLMRGFNPWDSFANSLAKYSACSRFHEQIVLELMLYLARENLYWAAPAARICRDEIHGWDTCIWPGMIPESWEEKFRCVPFKCNRIYEGLKSEIKSLRCLNLCLGNVNPFENTFEMSDVRVHCYLTGQQEDK